MTYVRPPWVRPSKESEYCADFKDETVQDLRRHAVVGTDDDLWEWWLEFSAIQAGTCLMVGREGVDRFLKWRETGDDEEAWS